MITRLIAALALSLLALGGAIPSAHADGAGLEAVQTAYDGLASASSSAVIDGKKRAAMKTSLENLRQKTGALKNALESKALIARSAEPLKKLKALRAAIKNALSLMDDEELLTAVGKVRTRLGKLKNAMTAAFPEHDWPVIQLPEGVDM